MKTAAEKMLDLARDRARTSDRGVGHVEREVAAGTVQVTYTAWDARYEVGTPARMHAAGQRRSVLEALSTLLGVA